MTLAKALLYFLREASLNLLRSFKVSLLAVLTIAVSLFVGGLFVLTSGNLGRVVEEWRRETKVIIYFKRDAGSAAQDAVASAVASSPWVEAVGRVSEAEAKARFQELFPSMADLVEGGDGLPSSLELRMASRTRDAAYAEWLAGLRNHAAVAMVDDDQEWLSQLSGILVVLRALGLGLGLILLAAAAFTIAAVVRLTAYLYREEIAIMRLVGATEFFIRGPFYAEGFLQGLLGGITAVGALFAAYRLALPRAAGSVWAELALSRFLSPSELLTLVLLGALAGLLGAVASLRRERLETTEE